MTPTELPPTEVVARLADRLDEDALPYAIGGALALGAWGVPRATSDVDISEMQRRRVVLPTPDGRTRWFLSLEDTAVAKLLYARPKDVQDLERLFAVQARHLDLSYLRHWLPRTVPAGDSRLQLLEELARRAAGRIG
jgi:hypothetical protein